MKSAHRPECPPTASGSEHGSHTHTPLSWEGPVWICGGGAGAGMDGPTEEVPGGGQKIP